MWGMLRNELESWTPVARPIPEYKNLGKNVNMAEGERRQVGEMESPIKRARTTQKFDDLCALFF